MPLIRLLPRGRLSATTMRSMSTSSAALQTVKLDYESFTPKEGGATNSPIVVCHGLFGSKQNWRSIGRAMSSRFASPVYAIDLRNHGTSPHIDALDYPSMASDIIRFLSEHALRDVTLIGHSLGGKTVMSVALSPELQEGVLSRLVSVDMSAQRGPLSPEFAQYIEAMLAIEAAKCTTRAEADEILAETEPDLGVRQFLLTNLTRDPGAQHWSWRIPVRTIKKHIASIGDFPFDAPGLESTGRPQRTWNGETLFVKGTKSKYVNRRNIPVNQAYFPNSKMITMPTGHWCQAEQPNEFIQHIASFINGSVRDETQEQLQPRSNKL